LTERTNPATAIAEKAFRAFREIRIPDPLGHPDTAAAQKLLNAGQRASHNMELAMHLGRVIDRELHERELRGRLSEQDTDVVRAMVAYSGAALDAALKQLIRDTVRDLIHCHEGSRKRFARFVDAYLAAGSAGVDRGRLVEVLADELAPQEVLFEKYERDLTGDSLQSVSKVKEVCAALGVLPNVQIQERLQEGGTLDQMFRARNAIVHQLDLKPDGTRTFRSLEEAMAYATEALTVTQLVINEVGRTLPPKSVDEVASG
jgi:hypothetical protein